MYIHFYLGAVLCALIYLNSGFAVPQHRHSISPSTNSTLSKSGEKYSQHTLIIFYDSAIGKRPLLRAVRKRHATILYDYKNFNAIAIKLPTQLHLDSAMHYFEKTKGVIAVQRDYIYQINKMHDFYVE